LDFDIDDWTTSSGGTSTYWTDVCWSPELELFAAVCWTGTNRIMTSPDGLKWTTNTTAADINYQYFAFSPKLNLLCAICNSGTNNRIQLNELTNLGTVLDLPEVSGDIPTYIKS
jgi:hypothetical protein